MKNKSRTAYVTENSAKNFFKTYFVERNSLAEYKSVKGLISEVFYDYDNSELAFSLRFARGIEQAYVILSEPHIRNFFSDMNVSRELEYMNVNKIFPHWLLKEKIIEVFFDKKNNIKGVCPISSLKSIDEIMSYYNPNNLKSHNHDYLNNSKINDNYLEELLNNEAYPDESDFRKNDEDWYFQDETCS